MKRVRWLKAHWPVTIRTLASKMKTQLFTPDSFDGFVIERVRDDSIEAHYIEKLNYKETVTDPFGNEESFDRITYRRIDFTLFSEFPHIELRDAHRSTREFLSKILELCNFSVAVEPVNVDLLLWVETLQKQLRKKVIVDSLQVAFLEIEPEISAKILLKGGKDVREALEHLSAKRKFTLEKIQVKIPVDHLAFPIHMSSAGIARIPEEHMNDYIRIVRQSLAAHP
ncbi:hypothetical protein [Undibacterium sp. CY21W]|uniref:hypothetical protein n=1 Tax=Undibacterium sp. CY21W TaxID=2762293 RepID=UPI00164B926D|nr:hypothetical protein [Undibacterium sp. CY21W]MBC3926951.1 hypothetical protein [Undibacterium sp. CY21W]